MSHINKNNNKPLELEFEKKDNFDNPTAGIDATRSDKIPHLKNEEFATRAAKRTKK